MAHMVPITEAKTRLSELVRDTSDEGVLLLRHSRPAAVLVSADRHEALLDEIEDLRDRLSIYEREHLGRRSPQIRGSRLSSFLRRDSAKRRAIAGVIQ